MKKITEVDTSQAVVESAKVLVTQQETVNGEDVEVLRRVPISVIQPVVDFPVAVKAALLACFENVAWTDAHGQDRYNELYAALYSYPVSITATFNQGSNVIYDSDALDDLKQYLTVTATYENGAVKNVAGYTLVGTLTEGTSTITVSYGGKTTTFEVIVTHVKTWLYHFEDTLVSSGSEDFGFTGVAAYGTGADGTGKSYYHHVGTEGNANTDPLGIYAIGLTDVPDLSGDFTISFWHKAVTASSNHALIATKYESEDLLDSMEALPTNVKSGWTVEQGVSPMARKLVGVRFLVVSGYLYITLYANDNTAINYKITIPNSASFTNWHHYAITRKNGVLRFFFDGEQIFSINYTKTLIFADQICIGNNWGTTAATASTLTKNGASDFVDDLYIAENCKWESGFDPSAITY